MLCSSYIIGLIEDFLKSYNSTFGFSRDVMYYLGFFKIVFSKYLAKKYAHASILINKKIMELIGKEDTSILIKVLYFIGLKFREKIPSDPIRDDTDYHERLFYDKSQYEMLKNYFDEMEISVEDIDNIVI
jgi:hypothetical protein